jgi:glycosyltransferase involved in cell wall biosynthesis
MNVLNVNMSLDPVTGGGTAERSLQISRSLVRAGHRCTILTTDVGLSTDYINQCRHGGLTIVALSSLWQRFYLTKPSQGLVEKLVASADVINLMNHWTLLNALVYRAARRLHKPYVVCPAGALPIFGRSKILKKLYNHFIGREIILHANECIAISPNEIEQFKSYGVQPDKVSVIPNGINPADYPESDGKKFRARYDIGDAPVILFLGRLNIIKGPDMLLEAFCQCSQDKRMKAYHLVFAGPDGGMLNELKRMVEASGVKDRVHFTGAIGGSEKSDAFRAADFLAIPSRHEAMSIVALEAGASGTPVLLTDVCGFDEVASIGGGKVVSASVEAIAAGLSEMVSQPKNLHKMGERLQSLVQKKYVWTSLVQQILRLLERILVEAVRS